MIKEGVLLGNRYQIMGRIGSGGMADVYKAIDVVLNRYVAVKVLKSEFREDETFVQKFRTEAQSAAGLTHPNIVTVYDVAEDRGIYYIVMELVEGITLKDYIQKKGQLTPKEVVGITVQVCSGIDMAHSNNIVHRDIKPQNIIISKEGKVKVTDFGIAKATSSNTISTNAMGSVHYTSPEQARGGFSDAKSDIYSLGISMYEMITGRLPFDGDSTVSVALKHLQEDIVAPSEYVLDIPYSLECIILKCTQKSPDRRYPNVNALIRDLKRSLAEPDGDFVKIAPFVSTADTVMITPEELEEIHTKSEYRVTVDEDEYDEDYDDEDYVKTRNAKVAAKTKKAEIDPKMAKIMKILTTVVAVIFVFILVYAVGSASGLFKFGPDIIQSEEEVTVPELVGKKLDVAKAECAELGYELKVDYAPSEIYEENYITDQFTEAGTALKKGSLISVLVSSGLKAKDVEIPSVTNKTEAEAKAILNAAGFTTIIVVPREHDEIPIEKAIDTVPVAGSMASPEDTITLAISTGPGQKMVPNLEGKTKEEAAALLEAVNLAGEVTEEHSADVAAGLVISQTIEYGTYVDSKEVVAYVVSLGPAPVEMVKIPTGLAGKSYSSVKATLSNLGLVAEPYYAESAQYAEGYVIAIEGEGEEVEKGTIVTVAVSTGSSVTEQPSTTPDQSTEGTGDATVTQ